MATPYRNQAKYNPPADTQSILDKLHIRRGQRQVNSAAQIQRNMRRRLRSRHR